VRTARWARKVAATRYDLEAGNALPASPSTRRLRGLKFMTIVSLNKVFLSIAASLGFLISGVLACCILANSVVAEEPIKLQWQDLVPKRSVPANPFAALTDDQRYQLGNVARIRDLIEAGGLKDDDETRKEGKQLSAKLSAQGLDVNALLARYETFKAKITAQRSSIDTGLDGKAIKVPGYLLPLTFDESGVSKFLLVPFVGACIHTPPPPRNQIIYIHAATPFKVKGLYMPVWVSGRMSTKPVKSELSYVDGRRQIEAGYSISDAKIARYTR
jgi:hypothetical protein